MVTPVNAMYLEDEHGLVYRAVSKKIIVDCVLSTAAAPYHALDVLADTQTITNAFREIDVGGILQSVTVIDIDHQSAANNAIDLYFLDAAVSIGTENSAPDITDPNAVKVQGKVSLVTANFVDFTGSMIGSVGNLGLVLKPISGTKNLAMAAVCGAAAAPTRTATGVTVRLGILQD